ncbi:MAG TPA: hypothetical protein VMW25_01205 [Clostridia bacterium]|nr:hypothetical protein [Clostridia bacterium]
MTKIVFSFLLLALFLQAASAIDVNSMSQAEFDAYILSVQQSVPVQQQVSVTMDSEMQKQFDIMRTELAETRQAVSRMQEKFAVLAQDNKSNIDAATEKIIAETNAARAKEISVLKSEQQAFLTERTNPIRMSLPLIGVFCILTAAFLLYVARTYNFKGGK